MWSPADPALVSASRMNGGILQYVVIFEYATSFGVYHVLIEVGRVNAMHERLG